MPSRDPQYAEQVASATGTSQRQARFSQRIIVWLVIPVRFPAPCGDQTDVRASNAAVTGRAILSMGWRDVLFAHYRADAARIAATLPPGIELDTFDGSAWLSVVPFRLTRVRLRAMPIVLPGFGDVPELNLRTYVRAGARRGIYFYTLDAGSPVAAAAARVMTGLPYVPARMRVRTDAGWLAFESERARRGAPDVRFRARFRPTGPTFATRGETLEAFLHDRFAFFTPRFGRIVAGEVAHAPWQLSRVDLAIAENTLGELIGYPLGRTPDLATFSRGVDVRASGVAPLPREAVAHGP